MQNNKKTDENKPLHVLHVFGRLNRGKPRYGSVPERRSYQNTV